MTAWGVVERAIVTQGVEYPGFLANILKSLTAFKNYNLLIELRELPNIFNYIY